MGEIADLANEWLRDFVTDGVPATGPNSPNKAEGRALFALLDELGLAGAFAFDGTNLEVRVGENLRPDPLYDDDATYVGKLNIFIGANQFLQTDSRTTHTIAIGYDTGKDAIENYGLTAIGFRNASKLEYSLYTTALGIDAMTYTETASNTTAVGAHCGTYKEIMEQCFIGGAFSAFSAGTLNRCVVIGYQAGAGITASPSGIYSFDDCVLIGQYAGRFNRANGNTFVGANTAASGNVDGASSSAFGSSALGSVSTGNNHVGIGAGAGVTQSTGSGCVFIGAAADANAGTYSNCVVIGFSATGLASNTITLGNASIATLRCQVTTITALSDRRFKSSIDDMPLGLDFINAIHVRQWVWNERSGRSGAHDVGVIAQELVEVQTKFGAEWLGLVDFTDPDRLEATPGKLIFPLINSVHELAAANDNIVAMIDDIKRGFESHEQRIARLEKEVSELKAAA